jgi:hypothetical protein
MDEDDQHARRGTPDELPAAAAAVAEAAATSTHEQQVAYLLY